MNTNLAHQLANGSISIKFVIGGIVFHRGMPEHRALMAVFGDRLSGDQSESNELREKAISLRQKIADGAELTPFKERVIAAADLLDWAWHQDLYKAILMNVHEYVASSLENASRRFLEEIIAHGIYNTGAHVEQGETDEEYETIDAEFRRQAEQRLQNLESEQSLIYYSSKPESKINKYEITANGASFGIYAANTEEEARNLCAQDAGESNSNEFYYRVQKPLEEIEL